MCVSAALLCSRLGSFRSMAMAGADTQIEETVVCGYASTRVDGKRPSHSGRHLQARRGALVALPVHGRWHNPLKEYG